VESFVGFVTVFLRALGRRVAVGLQPIEQITSPYTQTATNAIRRQGPRPRLNQPITLGAATPEKLRYLRQVQKLFVRFQMSPLPPLVIEGYLSFTDEGVGGQLMSASGETELLASRIKAKNILLTAEFGLLAKKVLGVGPGVQV